MSNGAAAAAADEPDASPLAFAWAWARKSLWIGRQTADVAVLATMGRHVHRLMADELERVGRLKDAEKDKNQFFTRVIVQGEGVWEALGIVKNCPVRAVRWLRNSPSGFERYQQWIESDDMVELRATVQRAAEKLGKEEESYGQLLGEEDMAQECEGIVDTICTLTGFILYKAELPASETVLLTVNGLATAE